MRYGRAVAVAYSWTILTGNMADLPVAMGITGERATAIAQAEAYLLRGEGFLADVAAVRTSLEVLTMSQCYEALGPSWVGRRTREGTVHWFQGRSRPDLERQPRLAPRSRRASRSLLCRKCRYRGENLPQEKLNPHKDSTDCASRPVWMTCSS
jgi:hypothetical protein